MGVMWTLGLNADAVRAATSRIILGHTANTLKTRTAYQGLALLHVLLSEQKLAIQVGEVDCVEIEKGDMTEPGKHDVLDWRKNGERRVPRKWKKHTELAADTASTHHEYFDVG